MIAKVCRDHEQVVLAESALTDIDDFLCQQSYAMWKWKNNKILSNVAHGNENIACLANILDIFTKLIQLCVLSYPE